MKFKKAMSILIAVLLMFLSNSSVYAASAYNDLYISADDFDIFSTEFPEAYIEKSFHSVPLFSRSTTEDGGTIVGYIEAKMHCLEEYEIINGQKVVINSRLLSEEEVGSQEKEIQPRISSEEVSNSKELLTIQFVVLKYGRGNRYQLTAKASWAQQSVSYPGSAVSHAEPSHEDFMGIVWGGDFNSSTYNGDLQYYLGASDTPTDSLRQTPAVSEVNPNRGIVWAFNERIDRPNGMEFRVKAMTFCDIGKNNLTGNGNTTQFGMQYIHTYGSVNGSISFNTGGSLGFSLSNTTNQWSVAVMSKNGYQY